MGRYGSLRDVPDDDLQEEIERRKAKQEALDALARPHPLEIPDWATLIKMVVKHVGKELSGQEEDDDIENYIYEQAVESVYGPDIFDAIGEIRALGGESD